MNEYGNKEPNAVSKWHEQLDGPLTADEAAAVGRRLTYMRSIPDRDVKDIWKLVDTIQLIAGRWRTHAIGEDGQIRQLSEAEQEVIRKYASDPL